MTLQTLSSVLGWAYFGCWSVSFYPQIYLNQRRRTCAGLSYDFILFNVVGFVCLAAYNSACLWSDAVRDEYRRRHDGKDVLVRLNDVVFAYHVLVLSVVIAIQSAYFASGRPIERPSRLGVLFISAMAALGAMLLGAVACNWLHWLDFVYYLSMVKLVATLFKCVPQLVLNHRLKSTTGWSIWNVILDTAGGILSMLQLVLDAYIANSWSGIVGNPVKLGLSVLSLGLDACFFWQQRMYGRGLYDHIPDDQHQQPITFLIDDDIGHLLSDPKHRSLSDDDDDSKTE